MSKEKMVEIADRFARKRRSALAVECAPEYQAYWRGYAAACDEAEDALRTQASEKGNERE